jgi:predicted phosphodiesterase
MPRNTNNLPSDTARTALASERFRKYPRLIQARILKRDNPLIYTSVEHARSTLRYLAGKSGIVNIKRIGDMKEFFEQEDRTKNPYNLPSSDESTYEPYLIKGHKRVAILSDIHIPFHSIVALTATFDFLKKEKPDAILCNGDIVDCHRLSKFIKDQRKRSFKQELDTLKEFFNILEKEFKCKIYYKLGNHEERYENYLFQKAGELVGIEEFEFANIIKARANGIEVIGDKRYMLLNKLAGIHGHEYVGGFVAPVNPARGLFNKGVVSSFQGHNHQASEHNQPTLLGKDITTWSVACLCELHPAFMPLNKWGHGFAIVDLDSNGEDYEFRNKRIIKGKVR